jgi:hypothetical protein
MVVTTKSTDVGEGVSKKNYSFWDYILHPELNPLNQNNYMQNGPKENNKSVPLVKSIADADTSDTFGKTFMAIAGVLGFIVLVLLIKD